MRIATFLYNGYYSFYSRGRLSTWPEFSAWVSLTLASYFYLLSVFNVLEGLVRQWTGGTIPYGLYIQIGIGIALALASDWHIRHTWFGAKKEDWPESKLRDAEFAAFLFFIGSWVAFIVTAYVVYAPD